NVYERVDVRIVAATNCDLRDQVAKKAFREDLYYRLTVFRIRLPSLRERGADDIELLARHFVQQFSESPTVEITPEHVKRLLRHSWPGNVRELRNVIERACVLGKGNTLNLEEALAWQEQPEGEFCVDVPFKVGRGEAVERFERTYLSQLLQRHGSNLASAAR